MVRLLVRALLAVLAALLAGSLAFPAAAAAPAVVVFPFSVGDGVPANLAVDVANKIATELTAAGGVTVIHGDPTSKLRDFRTIADAAGADAYLTGSIVSVGANTYTGIEQLVGARSGVLIWSNAITFRSVDDIVGGGRSIHDLLLNSGVPVTAGTLPTAPTATPVPQFAGIVILPVIGTASRPEKDLAYQSVTDAIKHLGFYVVPMPRRNNLEDVGLCGETHAKLVLSTRLETRRGIPAGGGAPQTTAIVSFSAFDCTTETLDPNPIALDRAAPDGGTAIRTAVNDALILLPALPPTPNG
jgi:TolB-like protein